MTAQPTILVVDDKASMRDMLAMALSVKGMEVVTAENGRKALEACGKRKFDAVISDLKMPGLDGMGLLRELSQLGDMPPFLMITAHGSVKDAVEAMALGAVDFVEKPFELEEFEFKVERALAEARAEHAEPGAAPAGNVLPGVIGHAPQLAEIADIVGRAARSNVPVLILGESGTGKELVARAVHELSSRRDGPFVAVNAGALAAGVLESELFGHEKGAFTGADQQRRGRFELAASGTLFLDELGELPLSTQVKLLRVLQEKRIERVGGSEPVPVDIRLVCATNKDLRQMVAEAAFREDLFYRVNVVTVTLPPLRERVGDIPLLVKHFLEREGAAHTSPEAWMERLRGYPWPGNVRELENVVRRCVALAPSDELRIDDLPPEVKNHRLAGESADGDGLVADLERMERNALQSALQEAGWNQSLAARLLGVGRTALQYKMKKYKLRKPEPKS